MQRITHSLCCNLAALAAAADVNIAAVCVIALLAVGCGYNVFLTRLLTASLLPLYSLLCYAANKVKHHMQPPLPELL